MAWRFVTEAVGLPAARASKLRPALRAAASAGYTFVVLDDTLILIDQGAADRPCYPGAGRKQGIICGSSTALPAGSCGSRAGCPVSSMTDHGPDLGHHPRAGRCRIIHAL
jgi:hypothetical protein